MLGHRINGKRVSTHSRPKAAGAHVEAALQGRSVSTHSRPKAAGFSLGGGAGVFIVSTHSRPKAAGVYRPNLRRIFKVSTHSRPKAAGKAFRLGVILNRFNSQPPEGGWTKQSVWNRAATRFNSQPPEGGWPSSRFVRPYRHTFQLTAARRRLAAGPAAKTDSKSVSTHSRPKAAGFRPPRRASQNQRFNSQPPEGGWVS